jgi:hypothetical protein
VRFKLRGSNREREMSDGKVVEAYTNIQKDGGLVVAIMDDGNKWMV